MIGVNAVMMDLYGKLPSQARSPIQDGGESCVDLSTLPSTFSGGVFWYSGEWLC